MLTELFQLWIDTDEYCKSERFDRKTFKSMCDGYTRAYKRLDYQEQGELAHMISMRSNSEYCNYWAEI